MNDLIELRFTGSSDDTFGEYGYFGDDYDNCASGRPIEWVVSNDEYAVLVTGQYGINSATWSIRVENYDTQINETPFPQWEMQLVRDTDRDYNPMLIIKAPSDVKLRCLQIKYDED